MIQKQAIKLDCLFLHNTQMTDLEKEQAVMRTLYAKVRSGTESALLFNMQLPFNILPPFCIGRIPEGAGKLTIEAPQNFDGWIIRPVNAIPALESPQTTEYRFPLYPPLPAVAGFVLGYAGEDAGGCIPETARAFTVKVWYHAKMTVTFEYEEEKSYAAFRETGKETWAKAVQ